MRTRAHNAYAVQQFLGEGTEAGFELEADFGSLNSACFDRLLLTPRRSEKRGPEVAWIV